MPDDLREHYLRALMLLRDMFEALAVDHLEDAPATVPLRIPVDQLLAWRTRAAAMPIDKATPATSSAPDATERSSKPAIPETTRHFLGVTDSGLRIGTAITGRFVSEHRPIPMSALRGDMAAMTGGDVFDPLLTSDESPLLWPVSAEVYRVFQEIDDEDDEDGESSP